MTNVSADSTPASITKLADGGSAELYAWGEEYVAKIYRAGMAVRAAKSEFRQARLVHELGVPSPKPERMVELDGRIGILFERCTGPTLYELIVMHPERASRHAEVLFELQQAVHACAAPPDMPLVSARLAAKIGQARDVAPAAKARALDRLHGIGASATLCHGDFHPINVIMSSAGPKIVDWSDAGIGDPLGDHARTLLLLGFGRPGRIADETRTRFLEAYTARCREAFGARYAAIGAWTLPLVVARLAEATDAGERARLLGLLEAAP